MLYLIENKIKESVNLRHWCRLYHSAEIVCRAKKPAWSLEWKKMSRTLSGQADKRALTIYFICVPYLISFLLFLSSHLVLRQTSTSFLMRRQSSKNHLNENSALHWGNLQCTAEEWGAWHWELLKLSTCSAFVILLFCVIRQSGIPGNTDLFVSCLLQIFL